MMSANKNWNMIDAAPPSFPPAMRCTMYTFPAFCEASQSSILINPMTGRAIGADFSIGEMVTTSSPPPVLDIRPNTNAQAAEWRTFVGVSEQVARHLLSTFEELQRIAELPHNWDTFGSVKTSPAAVNTARDLIWNAVIHTAIRKGVDGTPYAVAPLSGGGVQLEWRGQSGLIEVEVSPDGRFGYLFRRGEDGLGGSEEDDNVPRDRILDLISSVAG